jgi:Mlc titration factor MtfA (ptsG expression regulator)
LKKTAIGPDQSWEKTARSVTGRWQHLDVAETERLLEQARAFDRGWFWEGLDGLRLTSPMRAAITAQACLLTVNLGTSVFKDVTAVLVARRGSAKRTRHQIEGRVVIESEAHVTGEALLHGPLRLAWNQIEADLATDSEQSVVLHEFAHKVDMADGVADGIPPLTGRRSIAEFDRIAQVVLDQIRSGEPSEPLRDYAAINRSELFAVATEGFFLRPVELRSRFEDLYGALAGFYRQDPASPA